MMSNAKDIFYCVFSGKNYETKKWHKMPLERYQALPKKPRGSFDIYTLSKDDKGRHKVHRSMTSPSGDWSFNIFYTYGKDGALAEMEVGLTTLHGWDPKTRTVKPTEAIRLYRKNAKGEMELKKELVYDALSGDEVIREVRDWAPNHWNTLKALPLRPLE